MRNPQSPTHRHTRTHCGLSLEWKKLINQIACQCRLISLIYIFGTHCQLVESTDVMCGVFFSISQLMHNTLLSPFSISQFSVYWSSGSASYATPDQINTYLSLALCVPGTHTYIAYSVTLYHTSLYSSRCVAFFLFYFPRNVCATVYGLVVIRTQILAHPHARTHAHWGDVRTCASPVDIPYKQNESSMEPVTRQRIYRDTAKSQNEN